MVSDYGVSVYDEAGRQIVGFDNPCVLIDYFNAGRAAMCPPRVFRSSFDYRSGSKEYAIAPESKGIAVVGIPFPRNGNTYGDVLFLVYEVS